MDNFLSQINWDDKLANLDANSMWDKIYEILSNATEKFP